MYLYVNKIKLNLSLKTQAEDTSFLSNCWRVDGIKNIHAVIPTPQGIISHTSI